MTQNSHEIRTRVISDEKSLMDHARKQGTTSDVSPDDPLSSNLGKGTADDQCSNLGERHIRRSIPVARILSDVELLYHTLVADGAVPTGFLWEFLGLEDHVRRASSSARQKYVMTSEAAATMELERIKKQQTVLNDEERMLSDQLVMLAELKPRKFRTKWQQLAYDGQQEGETQRQT